MACTAAKRMAMVLMAVAGSVAQAQSLGEPQPINKLMDSAQFGMPSDAKYIFCDGEDCPDRTRKTLTAPKAVVAQAPVVVMPRPQSVAPPAELSPAKEPVKKAKKKIKRKPKRKPQVECKPVAEK